ncbi:Fucose 4-O-acetylase [Mucilaginibacter mallensis]|uniref:Fucose 4-O-acetylase n=1 Tax=Mucilaginibacter mallensis TaxID=652787 RepID=A0A1H2CC18_MUCMA|nr:acyltransferase [Mucilaginibacter mallensis]SDT67869.1 Fucose 4-O-acetylase [Mucilaginibacter mallensis]
MSTALQTDQPAIIPSQKIYYLDHIKVLLTVLVILHHSFITYGGPGGWYYRQPTTSEGALMPMTMFVSTNQSFFMGLFFLLSAYFVEPSLKRKGTKVYLLDRLKRLGIPLVFYSLILSPVLNFMVYHYGDHNPVTFMQFLSGYDGWIQFGVLWFVVALLLFTLLFVALYNLKLTGSRSITKLKAGPVLLFAAGLGLITFFVRLIFPVGWVLKPVGFQFGHFTQYIAMFTIGILARRGNLAEKLDFKLAKRFMWIAVGMLVILFPVLGIIQKVTHAPGTDFNGGWTLLGFLYSFYEQIIGVCIMVALTGISMYKWNKPSKFLATLSRNTFAVYIFHPLILIGLSLLLSTWMVDPVIKLAIVAPGAVIGSFLLAAVIVRIPGVNKVI